MATCFDFQRGPWHPTSLSERLNVDLGSHFQKESQACHEKERNWCRPRKNTCLTGNQKAIYPSIHSLLPFSKEKSITYYGLGARSSAVHKAPAAPFFLELAHNVFMLLLGGSWVGNVPRYWVVGCYGYRKGQRGGLILWNEIEGTGDGHV